MTISTETRINRIQNYINENDIPIHTSNMTDGTPCFIIESPSNTQAARFYRLLDDSRLFSYGEVVVGYYDEYDYCSDCYRYYPTQPSYYGDSPEGTWVSDCDKLCDDCLTNNLDSYIEHVKNDPQKAIKEQFVHLLKSEGFQLFSDNEYASGLHPGQTDNPQDIIAQNKDKLKDLDWLFAITGTGQFDVHFSLYTRPIDY